MIELKQIFWYLCIPFQMFKWTTQNMLYCTTFPRGKEVAYRNFANRIVSVSINLNYSLAEDYMFSQLTTMP